MEFALQFIADSINLLDVNTYMFQTNSANYNVFKQDQAC